MQEEIKSRLGLKASPTPAIVGSGNDVSTESGMLKTLEWAFLTPMLSLLRIYVASSNGTKRTIENCVLEFRIHHTKTFKLFYCVDFFFRLVYMAVVLVVVVRGLGIDEYIFRLINGGK
jgi:hypothetical protein